MQIDLDISFGRSIPCLQHYLCRWNLDRVRDLHPCDSYHFIEWPVICVVVAFLKKMPCCGVHKLEPNLEKTFDFWITFLIIDGFIPASVLAKMG